ncbi:MAG: sigma 54-interacting transcriptional regulator, partial [Myxococcota bacterium]|nr:sigma 54-interacting transcriptional regulator [Myxococcota bacterium]
MRRVLIAEPDTAFREALGDAVRNAGWYADAAPALDARTPRELGEYSAALVSIEPPGAAVAIGRLGAACAPLAVIAMGPADPPGPAVEALANGAREFLRKPFDVAALEAALANALDPARRSGAPPGVELLTRDPGVRRLLREAEAAAATDATVLVLGESGSGRSRLAQWIHTRSRRADAPVVFVRGGALAADAECELFGDGEGADCGLLGAVRGGTLVLEDVGELPLAIQARLVRRMQDGGEGTPLRVVATSKRPLANEVACGRLRPDLHHRLEVLVLRVPPLRERPRDIEWLAQLLLERAARARGAPTPRLSRGAL